MINGISLDCLMDILIITHDNIPNIIPFAIEYENGIKTIATKELKLSAIFSPNLIDLIDSIINSPTYIKAGAVANAGIAKKIGAKNRDTTNSPATVTAVRPVLPPLETPTHESA